MNRKVVSRIMLALLLIGVLTLSYPPTFGDGYNPAADIQDPNSQIYMDQPVYEFDSPPTEVGDKFNVTVIGYNISEIYAYQVVIDYNNTLLNCTNAWPHPFWVSYIDQPSVGLNAELVGDLACEFNLTDPPREGLLARFEFEILSVPEAYEELSCVLSISNSWAAGTFVQSAEEASALQKRSPWLTDSDYNIKGVLAGDLNDDGIINIIDVIVLADAFGAEPGDPNWNPDADLNDDGIINILDAILIARDFGKTS